MQISFLSFLHSLLRYGVLLALLPAFLYSLRGWLTRRPVLTLERMFVVVAMVLCHVQLVVGLILYLQNMRAFNGMSGAAQRFWKYEHPTAMLLAVALVTAGRMLSKRSTEEGVKQRHIVIFYGIGLALILWAIPWPFREVGRGLGWL